MAKRESLSLLAAAVLLPTLALLTACGSAAPPPPPIGPPTLVISPSHFSFSAQEGGDNPTPKILCISSSENIPFDWAAHASVDWLYPAPSSGSSTGDVQEIQLCVDIESLSAGSHSGTLTISVPGASNTAEVLPVDLTISYYSQEHKVTLHLDPKICPPDEQCKAEELVQFNIREQQRIRLWWYAYGEKPAIYVTLSGPVGEYGGHIKAYGGPVESFSPSPWSKRDGGRTGRLSFYCSNTYDKHCSKTLYPPGTYTLSLAAHQGYPDLLVKPSSEADIEVTYLIESVPS
jgi:hypothetical protein